MQRFEFGKHLVPLRNLWATKLISTHFFGRIHHMSERDSVSNNQIRPNMFENVINSVRVAPQWHAPSVIASMVTALDGHVAFKNVSEGNVAITAFAVIGILAGTLTCGISESLAVKYTRAFNKMKNSMAEHGWDERIVKNHAIDYCGKRASRIAATDAGYLQEFKEYIECRG